MIRFRFAIAGAASLVVLSSLVALAKNGPRQQAASAPAQTAAAEPSDIQKTNDAFVAKISKQIEGHEQEPAGKVFKNVHIMTNAPAARFLLIMNLGYSRALGVTCTHCHVEGDFSSDDKRPKRAAREMAAMHRSI